MRRYVGMVVFAVAIGAASWSTLAQHGPAAPIAIDYPAVQQRRRLASIGSPHEYPPGRPAQRSQVILQDQPAPVDHADPGT